MFHRLSKYLEFRQKYYAARRSFDFGVEVDPQDVESSRERETVSLFSSLTPILQDKKQTDDQNKNTLRFFWNRYHLGLSREVMNATLCYSSCQRSAMLWWNLLSLIPIKCCRCWSNLTPWTRDWVTLLQSPYFFRPLTPSHGHFVLSPVSLISRDQDGGSSDSTIDIEDITGK